MLRTIFTEHPASVGESYTEHMGMSWSFGAVMIKGGLACFLHGLVPALCTRTGSTAIRRLHDLMVVNRNRHTPADDPMLAAIAI